MNRVLWRWIAALGLVWGAAGCGGDPPAKEPAAPRPVKLAVAETRSPERLFSASGMIKAAQRAELSFDRAEILVDLPVVQGQLVKKGETLARLDTRNLEIAEKARQAAFDEARVTHDRYQRLFARQAVAQADLERAQAALQTAEANLRQIRKDLETSELRAPFTGRIASIQADPFQLVQPRQTIMVVHDLSRYKVEVQVPETFILQVGQAPSVSMNARFDQLPDRVFPVTLKDFTTEANPDTLTYNVVFTLDAPEGTPLLPGMSVSLDLVLRLDGPAESCWVPERALFSDNAERTLVWRVDPASGRVAQRVVLIGARRGGFVQVLEGLASGDTVTVSGLHNLREGDAVRAYEPPNRS